MNSDDVKTEMEYLLGRGTRVPAEHDRLGRSLWPLEDQTPEDRFCIEVGHHVDLDREQEPEPDNTVSCQACKFFSGEEGRRWGQCRHQPPVQSAAGEASAWPEVRVDDWCGRFLRPYRQSDKL